jgi:hypothetical protein
MLDVRCPANSTGPSLLFQLHRTSIRIELVNLGRNNGIKSEAEVRHPFPKNGEVAANIKACRCL